MSTAISKIPVATGSAHRRNSNGGSSRNGSPERKKSSPSKIPTPTNNGSSPALKVDRPQSIDIEDEFKNTLQYARLVSSLKHNHDSRIPIKSRESSPVKNGCEQQLDFCNSPGGGSPTKSKIPVLQGCQTTSASSSLSSSSPPRRKLSSQPATCKKDSTDPKQKYEAFMMTGDRIIHLAKTPAAAKNKQQRVVLGNDLPMMLPIDFPEQDEQDGHHQRTVLQNKEQNKSESDNEEDCGSRDTLLEDQDKSNRHRLLLHHSGGNELEGSKTSPDFSTSSLISSEHYNGESLLDNLSNSSSPDTPEWSLVDSFHKQQRRRSSIDKAPLLTIEDEKEESEEEEVEEQVIAETNEVSSSSSSSSSSSRSSSADEAQEAIKSEGNRVIITITGSEGSRSSNATDSELSILSAATAATASTVINAGQDSGSEESDLESLRSYHPPLRTVDVPSAERLAKRLYYLDGFKRTDVSRHLGKNNDFSQVVAEEYLRHFELGDCISLDQALRRFLQQFCLSGETQERERVLLHFSKRYLECNPSLMAPTHFRSLDAVHTLTCAIMLLNTDLHGDNLQRKMTCNEFIENLRELNDGQNFPRDLLRSTYYSIKEAPIPWATDEPEEPANSPKANVSNSANDPIKTVISAFSDIATQGGNNIDIDNHVNPFLELPNASTAVDFKKGYVMRKCCVDPNGKKTKLGKRSWRMFFLTLRDMVLYCFKDEKSPVFDDLSAAIRIHHGLAVRASDYTKKKHVFRLYTCDRAEYLFQTSDEKELLTWIDAINYVVASYSAPQLPAACSSSSKFQRPLMPSSKSSLEMSDQLASHEVQLQQLRREYEEELRATSSSRNNPQLMSKSKSSWSEYKEKEEFLLFEIMRYETYILTLRTKNAHDT